MPAVRRNGVREYGRFAGQQALRPTASVRSVPLQGVFTARGVVRPGDNVHSIRSPDRAEMPLTIVGERGHLVALEVVDEDVSARDSPVRDGQFPAVRSK